MVEYSKARLGADGKIELYDQKTINPRRCPHHIIMGEHYRDDGSCRCNDITATVMTKWGYTWDATAQLWEAGEDE